ncbi:MAG TPA: cupin domain-containing protein, partial [Candidatus Acidoferrales bacterium]|nr:cupin domain-containing protein [Candidatus Acidoferrales bacterium]
MDHPHSIEEAQERAALYALGTLRGEEQQQFEAHLRSGCSTCASEVQAFLQVTNELAYAGAPTQPDASLRERALSRATMSIEPAVLEKDGLLFVRSRQVSWEPGRAPKVEVKTLHVDRERGVVTKLVRMAAGAKLIAHRHADIEESYVLEGDLLV